MCLYNIKKRSKILISFMALLIPSVLFPLFGSWSMLKNLSTITDFQQEPLTVKVPKVFALLTEPRCVPSAPFVLNNALERLAPSIKVVFFHSHHNEACVQQWVDETPALLHANSTGRLLLSTLPIMDPFAKDIYSPTNWNNVLYTNASFWNTLYDYGDTVFTIQSDTLICAKPNSSYIPPWHVNFLGGISTPTKGEQPSNNPNHFYLNGGLSIRQLDWVLSCLKHNNNVNTIVEDAVFNNCSKGRELVSVVDAMAFASDNGFTKCFDWNGQRQCPWGVHKPWMYTHGNYTELLKYCPELKKLQVLAHFAKHAPPKQRPKQHY